MSNKPRKSIPASEQTVEDGATLLDPAWERQQRKTFTAWCNSHLRKVDITINEIEQDLRDGLALIKLLEVIASEKLPKPEKGKMRFHKIANVNKALNFVISKGVKLVSIGAEEIVDGNRKMTLGMIWTIILRFAIMDIAVEQTSAKEGLLLWCQKKTQPYRNVNIRDFHASWQNGLGFCALIHRHRPELLDYHSLDPENAIENLNLAFDVADKALDIPPMLDAEDISTKPDERAVMTYVSSYYHAFASSSKAEMASKRIGNVLDVTMKNEQMMEEYEFLSSDLLEWIAEKIPWLSSRPEDDSIESVQQALEEFRTYRSSEKPPKASDKTRLGIIFSALQTRLRIANRPAYAPGDGKVITDINDAWENLERVEREFEEWIYPEFRRLKRLSYLLQRFERKSSNLENWIEGTKPFVEYGAIDSLKLAEVSALKKKFDAFMLDFNAHIDSLAVIEGIVEEINNLGFTESERVNDRFSNLQQEWQYLGDTANNFGAEIENCLQRQQRVDELKLEFTKLAAPVNKWLDGAIEDLEDIYDVNSLKELEELEASYNELNEEFAKTEPDRNRITEICENLKDFGAADNEYTTISAEDIDRKWDEISDLLPQKSELLAEFRNKQMSDEELRKAFAEKANEIGPWIEEKNQYVGYYVRSMEGTLEDQLDNLLGMEQEIKAFGHNINEIFDISKKIHDAMIFENPYSKYTIESIRSMWDELINSVHSSIQVVDNEKLARDSKGITNEQLQEFKQAFNHFDKDKSGVLEIKEFRQCLVSVGLIPDIETNDEEFEHVLSVVDPDGSGTITIQEYIDYMIQEISEQDTADQIVESFRTLANDKPYITEEELRHELAPDYAEFCIKRMMQYDQPGAPADALDYTSFSSALYGESDL
ncbi:uncharacterized protein TRIADDRAFT_37811 [Trichoplax adhaerens]|uniref:Alpha-actinin n=1 Tax=Trichoplax adhaerens TaxID=10228 RepID=B3S0V2_TRIAD|nr:hypothetical protein TRIADDRAFT_37811 [Trichoplax adhaerens]EDV23711.1 hypothetical protein TRIADDRAFT_37811 [Trichoplax adhaerens]|eukprot:XP_002113237.1 hypothetical protein TRIADDRAFT_37811 [Trichoplax adhaerens]